MSTMTDTHYNNKIYWDVTLSLSYGCKFEISTCNKDCKICLDTMKDKYTIKLKCSCIFHRDCLYKCFYNNDIKCPTCNKKIKKTTNPIDFSSFVNNTSK